MITTIMNMIFCTIQKYIYFLYSKDIKCSHQKNNEFISITSPTNSFYNVSKKKKLKTKTILNL